MKEKKQSGNIFVEMGGVFSGLISFIGAGQVYTIMNGGIIGVLSATLFFITAYFTIGYILFKLFPNV